MFRTIDKSTKMWKVKLCVFIMMSVFTFVKGQHQNVQVETGFRQGSIYPHVYDINYLIAKPSRILEISVSSHFDQKNFWGQKYNYPRVGVGLMYADIGNKEVFGEAYAGVAYIQMPALRKDSRFNFDSRIGVGLAYLTTFFGHEGNYKNVLIGSHLNFCFDFKAMLRYKLLNDLEIGAGLGFTHFSNGNALGPNLGVNIITYTAHIAYCLGEVEDREKVEEPEFSKFELATSALAGVKSRIRFDREKYFVSNFSSELRWRYAYASCVSGGVDVFYDTSIKDQIQDEGGKMKAGDSFQYGLNIGYQKKYRSMTAGVYVGKYLFTRYTINPIYYKLIFSIAVTKNISAGVMLHTHGGNANFVGWGLGYTLYHDKKK